MEPRYEAVTAITSTVPFVSPNRAQALRRFRISSACALQNIITRFAARETRVLPSAPVPLRPAHASLRLAR